MLLNGLKGVFDECGLIHDIGDPEVGWQTFLQLGDSLFHRMDHSHRVGTGLLTNFQNHSGGAVQAGNRARLLKTVCHLPHVANADRRSSGVANDDTAEILGSFDTSQCAKGKFSLALVDSPPRDFNVLGSHGASNLIDIEVVRIEVFTIEPDLNLPNTITDKADLADAAEGFNVLLDQIIDQLGRLAEIPSGCHSDVDHRGGIR